MSPRSFLASLAFADEPTRPPAPARDDFSPLLAIDAQIRRWSNQARLAHMLGILAQGGGTIMFRRPLPYVYAPAGSRAD